MSENINKLDQAKDLKVKRTIMWLGIFSIIMIFAGFTSGYIVASGSDFWVYIKQPSAFLYSTLIILASSLTYILGVKLVKKGDYGKATILFAITFIAGLLFGIFQYQGFITLSKNGNTASGGIINVDGKYGENYTLYYQNKEISFDGNTYFWQGEPLDKELEGKMMDFCQEIYEVAEDKEQPLGQYGIFILKYKNTPIVHLNNRLEIDGFTLSPEQKTKLKRFADAIITGRGDFYMIGTYGEDFTIYYKQKAVEYANRKFYQNGQELSAYQLSKLNGSPNRASGFIFAFVFVHLIHWFAGMIVLLVVTIKTLKHKYSNKNHNGLIIGGMYWHFLGILWLFLYFFLIFFIKLAQTN